MSRLSVVNGLLLGSVLALATQLHADPAPATDAPAATTKGAAGVDVTKASPAELQSRADAFVGQLNDNLKHAEVARVKAHKARDVLMLNCVDGGLLVTKQLANSGDDAHGKLVKAIAANDVAGEQTSIDNLAAAVHSAQQSRNDIDACVGGSETKITGPDGSKTTVSHPLMLDNPTDDCNNLGVSNCMTQKLEYVAYASPFAPN